MTRMQGFLPMVLLTGSVLAPLATPSEELELGAPGPKFELVGTDGERHTLQSLAGNRGTAIIFTCNMCPYSLAYEDRIIALARAYRLRGINFVAINPNNAAQQSGEEFQEMVRRAEKKNYPFAYLRDATQAVATAYGARVTPHVFLLDASGLLVYRGRVDDAAWPERVTVNDLEAALDAIVTSTAVVVPSTRAFGCAIKWFEKTEP